MKMDREPTVKVNELIPFYELAKLLFKDCNRVDDILTAFNNYFDVKNKPERYQKDKTKKLDISIIIQERAISCTAASILIYFGLIINKLVTPKEIRILGYKERTHRVHSLLLVQRATRNQDDFQKALETLRFDRLLNKPVKPDSFVIDFTVQNGADFASAESIPCKIEFENSLVTICNEPNEFYRYIKNFYAI